MKTGTDRSASLGIGKESRAEFSRRTSAATASATVDL
jgi:hypothetical protein